MTVEHIEGVGTVLTGNAISVMRMVTLREGLRLEIKGLQMTRGRTCYARIKEEFKLTGNKKNVLSQFEEIVERARINSINNPTDQPATKEDRQKLLQPTAVEKAEVVSAN